MKTQDDLYFCALAVVHLNTLKHPLQFYGFHCDFCSEPKKLFIITTGSKIKSIDLCIQFILSFNEENIFKYLCKSGSTRKLHFLKVQNQTQIYCAFLQNHTLLYGTTAIRYHQRIYSLSSAAVIHTFGSRCKMQMSL